MCIHLVNVAVPRYQAKKLLIGGAKVLKNLEEETGKIYSHSSLHCSLQCWGLHAIAIARFRFESIICSWRSQPNVQLRFQGLSFFPPSREREEETLAKRTGISRKWTQVELA